MITVNDLLKVMHYVPPMTLNPDSFFQIMDSETNAHYRIESETLLLGGDPVDFGESDLRDFEVIDMDFTRGQVLLWVKGR